VIASVSSRSVRSSRLEANAGASLMASGYRGPIPQPHTVSCRPDPMRKTKITSCVPRRPHRRIVSAHLPIECKANGPSALHYYKIVENEHFVR
jgi:hypothetical protein